MKNQSNLTRDLMARGLYHPRCGVAAINLALRLRSKPLSYAERVAGCMKKSGLCSIGTLILAGLARYVADEKIYVITPAGETWLTELEIHGFLNADEGGRVKTNLPITDPKHPLQMDLSAAERHVSKWRNIAASCGDDLRKRTWSRANLAYHEGRVEGFKKLIAEEKGAA